LWFERTVGIAMEHSEPQLQEVSHQALSDEPPPAGRIDARQEASGFASFNRF
jgi:hypothetical protein